VKEDKFYDITKTFSLHLIPLSLWILQSTPTVWSRNATIPVYGGDCG